MILFESARIISGLVLAFGVLIILLINEYILNFAIFGLLLFFAFKEGKTLLKTEQGSLSLVLAVFVLGTLLEKPLLIGVLLYLFMLGVAVYKKEKNLNATFIYLYPTLPVLALWQVYVSYGIFALFWLIFIVCLCDSGAYFVGKFIGKSPFSASSPNKTKEGVIAGLIFGTLFGALLGLFVYNFFFSLLISFLVCVFAVIGDLLESYLKRKAKVKDSGDLIPGHGGILDRIDALIIASFVMVALL